MNFLKAPFSQWTAEKIHRYFHTRTGIHYFALEDEKETTPEKLAGLLENRFSSLGEMFILQPGFDWKKNPGDDIEWHIMLHKFYYGVGLARAFHQSGDRHFLQKWLELTESWIDQQIAPGFIASDVTGRRIQNWIFGHYYLVSRAKQPVLPAAFYAKFLCSLHEQVSWLIENLTPGRNHRTLELYAIFLAAVVFPEMRPAADWLAFSKIELFKNLQSDFQSDGVHCEQSTDYHHIVLRNFLGVRRLAQLNDIAMPDGFDALLKSALDFAKNCHKPDGHIPSLSDGDAECYLPVLQAGYDLFGDPEWLYVASRGKQGVPPNRRSCGYADSGYYFVRSGWGENGTRFENEHYLAFDCGPLGRGNHGHFDALNIELYAFGRSLIVDPGRYTYDEFSGFNWRALFRGTSYHNTVTVDGKNQTRYRDRGPGKRFKIAGPQPDCTMKTRTHERDFDFLHGIARSHEYDAVHERKIFFVWPEYWIVTDVLRAKDEHAYDLRFHLSAQAEGKTVAISNRQAHFVDSPNLLLAQPRQRGLDMRIDPGFVSAYYGEKKAAPIVNFSTRGRNRQFHTVLVPYRKQRPQVAVELLDVWRGDQLCKRADATALAIHFHKDERAFSDLFFAHHGDQNGAYRFGRFVCESAFGFVRVHTNGEIGQMHGQLILTRGQSLPARIAAQLAD